MHVNGFSFAAHAENFDKHITNSIPGYDWLNVMCIAVAHRFAQEGTGIVDIGCSKGTLLQEIGRTIPPSGPFVRYTGFDSNPAWAKYWPKRRGSKVDFVLGDARTFAFGKISLALSLFTIQFIPEHEKDGVLQRVYDAIVPGGAMIIAEKVIAKNSRLQDALIGPYYDFKRLFFSAEEILDKEKSLRGMMTCWSEAELIRKLHGVGFGEVQTIWASFPFICVLALKSA